jgi:hypothetical protein
MVRQVNVTGAESCWDDGFEDDGSCEKYLQQKKAELVAEDHVEEDDYEEEESEEESDDSTDDEEIHASAADDETDEESDESEEIAEADEKPVTAKSAKGPSIVKAKTSGSKITKADAIRAIISAKQDAGAEIRPRDIKAELEKQGIEVNASQISITLRAMGVPAAKTGVGRPAGSKNKAAAGEPVRRATARFAPVAAEEDGEDKEAALNCAADLLKTAGSYEAAVSALNFCRKLTARN